CQCYPALVAPRMVGLRRRNPVTLGEAFLNTPGLNLQLRKEFFKRVPSPIAPPAYYLAQQPQKIGRFQRIPW
ncbi:hypothetical protein R6G71_06635, partial [Actinobaculum suis]